MNVSMCLVAGKGIVRRIFEINGLGEILKIYASLEEASAAQDQHGSTP